MESQRHRILGFVLILLVGALAYWGTNKFSQTSPTPTPTGTPRVIEEELILPNTENITTTEGRSTETGRTEVPLVPKEDGERVIAPQAILTTHGVYNLAHPTALSWASDATLVFIKSLGTVTLEGTSTQWQLVFAAKTKKAKGYEIIVWGKEIVSKKEVDASTEGADLPESWIDSPKSIQALQELPQFSNATVSSINLYYNTDARSWRYALATSEGTTSMPAQ